MHPKWLQGGPPEAFLLPLMEVGLSALEFTLSLDAADWPEIHDLIRACLALGCELSFHAPHKGFYNPSGFAGPRRPALEQLFAPALAYAAAIAGEQGPTTLVVHGAKGQGAREPLRCDTVAFLSWIEGQDSNLCPALELRTRDQELVKMGDSRADLVATLSRWRPRRGGICWDMGHDAHNGAETAPAGFLEGVSHVHVHDLSPEGEDHYPLLFGNVAYKHHLLALRQVGYDRAIILEVNGYVVTQLAREGHTTSGRILRESFSKLAEPFRT
jgi:sugar phosphate isomerase/epimerase